jgi:hypothetical protein
MAKPAAEDIKVLDHALVGKAARAKRVVSFHSL